MGLSKGTCLGVPCLGSSKPRPASGWVGGELLMVNIEQALSPISAVHATRAHRLASEQRVIMWCYRLRLSMMDAVLI